jgi:hypothetical protein
MNSPQASRATTAVEYVGAEADPPRSGQQTKAETRHSTQAPGKSTATDIMLASIEPSSQSVGTFMNKAISENHRRSAAP